MKIYKRLLLFCFISLLICGCVSITKQHDEVTRHRVVLDTKCDYPDSAIQCDFSIRDFKVAKMFSDKPFVYRTGASTYTSDYYNQFYVFPANNLREELEKWIIQKKVFSPRVVDGGELKKISILVVVNDLYVDIQDKKNPFCVVSFSFKTTDGFVCDYFGEYKREMNLPELTVANILEAWQISIVEIVKEFVGVYKERMANESHYK